MPLLLADASPIIAFSNGNQRLLLTKVVCATHGCIEVPHFVDSEIHGKCSRVGAENYLTMKSEGVIRVYQEPMFNGPDEDIILAVLDLLDLEDGEFHERVKDGGEAFAVAYATRHKKSGTVPNILMDDRQGREWAEREAIPTLRTLWIFEEAKRQRIITTRDHMIASYNAVRRHTRALRDLSDETHLLQGLT